MKNENKIKVIVDGIRKKTPRKHASTKIASEKIVKAIQPQFGGPLSVEETSYSFEIFEKRTKLKKFLDIFKIREPIIRIYIPKIQEQFINCQIREDYAFLKNAIIKELNTSAREMKINKIQLFIGYF